MGINVFARKSRIDESVCNEDEAGCDDTGVPLSDNTGRPGTAGTAFGRTGTGTEDISLNIGAGSGEGAGGAGAGGEGAGIGEGIGTGVAFLGAEAEMVNGAEILLGKDGNCLAAADLTSTT